MTGRVANHGPQGGSVQSTLGWFAFLNSDLRGLVSVGMLVDFTPTRRNGAWWATNIWPQDGIRLRAMTFDASGELEAAVAAEAPAALEALLSNATSDAQVLLVRAARLAAEAAALAAEAAELSLRSVQVQSQDASNRALAAYVESVPDDGERPGEGGEPESPSSKTSPATEAK